MMLFKLFFVYLVINSCSADMFETIYKSQGVQQNATACALDWYNATWRACDGVIWRLAWLIVRRSCLETPRVIYVRKGNNNCTRNNTTVTLANGEKSLRSVLQRYNYLKYPTEDLSLLRLDWAYDCGSINQSLDYGIQEMLDQWIEYIGTNEKYYTTPGIDKNIYTYNLQMYTTPMKMFLLTVILPTISFIMIFIYIIFYTGTSEKTEIPYKHLFEENKNV